MPPIELLHTAFVIHDDVIDDDHLRRGRPNVSGTFRARGRALGATDDGAGYGLTAAILAGDLALAAAVRAVALCGAAPDVVRRLLDLFDSALHTTAAGELADVRLTLDHGPVTLAESLAMEEQKTSAYSFALPLRAGAVLAGADAATTARLGEVGRAMGVAFQLVDDLIGVFGDPDRSGKSATCDLRTRKQTPADRPRAVDPRVGRDPRLRRPRARRRRARRRPRAAHLVRLARASSRSSPSSTWRRPARVSPSWASPSTSSRPPPSGRLTVVDGREVAA